MISRHDCTTTLSTQPVSIIKVYTNSNDSWEVSKTQVIQTTQLQNIAKQTHIHQEHIDPMLIISHTVASTSKRSKGQKVKVKK